MIQSAQMAGCYFNLGMGVNGGVDPVGIFDSGNLLFCIDINGAVGIGDWPSKGMLTIENGLSQVIGSYYYVSSTTTGSGTGTTGSYSIWANERIACAELDVVSDQRIKAVEGISDAGADLITLLKLEVTDYRYKDTPGKGGNPHKKLIGQQVADVYPQAVDKVTGVVPDIYRLRRVGG